MAVREVQEPHFPEGAPDNGASARVTLVQMNLNCADAADESWVSPRPSVVAFSLL